MSTNSLPSSSGTVPVKDKSATGLVSVMLEVHLWSGLKRLRKEQLVAQNPEFQNLPPASLATLGSIKICDKADLKPFSQLKREAEKLLAINGLPFLGSIAVPKDKLDKVYRELSLIQAKFNSKRDSLFKRFDDAIEAWRAHPENAEWIHLIHDIPTPEKAAGKMSFGFHLYRVSEPSEIDGDANRLFAGQMTGLKGELFSDASKEAESLIANYLNAKKNGVVSKREKVTWKTLRPLKRIGEKFSSFAFLDPSCEPMAQMIDHVLGLLPADGPIDGVHLMHIWTLAEALSQPQRAMSLAAMAFTSTSPAIAFQSLLSETPDFSASPVEVIQPAPTEDAWLQLGAFAENSQAQPATENLVQESTSVVSSDDQPTYVGVF